MSWKSIHHLSRYVSLDQRGGPANITMARATNAAFSWLVYVLPPTVSLHEQHKSETPASALIQTHLPVRKDIAENASGYIMGNVGSSPFRAC